MAEHLNGKQSPADRPNDSVHRVPSRVEPWNFISKKFQKIQNAGDRNDRRVSEDLQRLILRRERDPVEMDGESSNENREVKIDAGQAGQTQRDSKKIQSFH